MEMIVGSRPWRSIHCERHFLWGSLPPHPAHSTSDTQPIIEESRPRDQPGGGGSCATVTLRSLLTNQAGICYYSRIVCQKRRRRQLREADVVVRLRLSDALRERLALAAALHGPAFQAAGAAMDPALANQLQEAVRGA